MKRRETRKRHREQNMTEKCGKRGEGIREEKRESGSEADSRADEKKNSSMV